MSDKVRTGIILDADVYYDAKSKFPNLSRAVNDLLSRALRVDDEEEVLRARSEKLRLELELVNERLSEISVSEDCVVSDRDKVIGWANDVCERKGVVGLNMLRNECRKYRLDVDSVRSVLEDDGVVLVNFA